MAKERLQKADKKAKREHKQELGNKASKKVTEAGAAAGKNKIKDEDKNLLKESKGVKPKPPKAKGKYSGMNSPPEPPLPLLDLIHNFLSDFKYIKAAHGVRTDNQKRPGHNLTLWKSTSEGYPDLIDIFNQWKEQNPAQVKVSQDADKTPKGTEDMALGVLGAIPEKKSKKAQSMKAAKEDSSLELSSSGSDSDIDSDTSGDSARDSASDSDSDSDSESSIADDNGMELDDVPVKAVHTNKTDVTSKNLKRKASQMSSSDSSSEEDSEDTSSASDSAESSNSSSESEPEAPQPNKRRKLDSAATPASKATKKSTAKDSSSSSESDSDSDGSSQKQDTAHIGLTNQPNSSGSECESDDDSDSDSSSSSSSDSEDGGVPTVASKLVPSKSAPATNGSDTSATLHYPSDIASATPAKAPYSTSGSSSESSTAVEEPPPARTNGEIHPDRIARMNGYQAQPTPTTGTKSEVLVFKDPQATNPSATQTLPATASNVSKLKKQAVPFSRIPENVQVDQRFSSNKYVPYDYANRAHEDLVVTKGKGFTKEKNKKKRGSYRGGLIDMAPKGIKFDD